MNLFFGLCFFYFLLSCYAHIKDSSSFFLLQPQPLFSPYSQIFWMDNQGPQTWQTGVKLKRERFPVSGARESGSTRESGAPNFWADSVKHGPMRTAQVYQLPRVPLPTLRASKAPSCKYTNSRTKISTFDSWDNSVVSLFSAEMRFSDRVDIDTNWFVFEKVNEQTV